ncbi:unnamed protein product [Arabidopsis lyrata]|nr:unnamed protein product [Arabidopsis lyrata]
MSQLWSFDGLTVEVEFLDLLTCTKKIEIDEDKKPKKNDESESPNPEMRDLYGLEPTVKDYMYG